MGQEPARVIVDEAVAVGLADDGDNLPRIDQARRNGLAQSLDIAGIGERKPMDVRLHALSPRGREPLDFVQLTSLQ